MKESEEYGRSIVGRGAAGNPKNRFEKIAVEPDLGAWDPKEQGSETVYLRDASRSIIARNNSPDIGFDASINPYRGCNHGCIYCLSGDTPILMADGNTKRLEEVRIGDEIYGTVRRGAYRRYQKTRVLDHWSVRKPAYRVALEDGTSLVCGGDHSFLTERGWKFVTGDAQGSGRRPYLTTNNKLMGTGAFAMPPVADDDYRRGYLCGMLWGDGLLASYAYKREGRTHGNTYQFRLALIDDEALRRAGEYLLGFEVMTHSFVFQWAIANKRSIQGIRTSARGNVERIRKIVAWPFIPSDSWRKGFLAGIFDAEGSYSSGILRIFNTDQTIIDHVILCLEQLGFAFVVEHTGKNQAKPLQVVRLLGGLKEHLRFFHTVDPVIARKRDIEGQPLKSAAKLRVASIEPLDTMTLFDITTGTGDFIADGVVSHNCFARPTHEYLGFSAGLDFESRILVKEDARSYCAGSCRPRVGSPR